MQKKKACASSQRETQSRKKADATEQTGPKGKLVRISAEEVKKFARSPEARAMARNVKARGGPTKEDLEEIPALTDKQLAAMAPFREFWKARKQQITLRVDADILNWFKKSGNGYQSRINEALRRYMNAANA